MLLAHLVDWLGQWSEKRAGEATNTVHIPYIRQTYSQFTKGTHPPHPATPFLLAQSLEPSSHARPFAGSDKELL